MSADNTVHVQFGISNAYVAVIDDDGEYATPFPVPGFVKLTIDAAGDSTTKYADNVPVYTSNANAGYTGSLEFTTICDMSESWKWMMPSLWASTISAGRSTRCVRSLETSPAI